MGSCGISRKNTSTIINNNNNVDKQTINPSTNVAPNPERTSTVNQNANQINRPSPENENSVEDEFKDMEEYENEWTGEGIKRIKAYKFLLPFDKLYKLRQDFWQSKLKKDKGKDKFWSVIKQACESDHYQSLALLSSAGIAPIENLKLLIDNNNNLYKVPNFCICEPLLKKEFIDKKVIKEEIIKVGIVEIYNNSKATYMKIPNNVDCLELKKCYADAKQIDLEKNKIRALYQGQEIKDDHTLGQHNIVNGSKIQFAIRKITIESISSEEDSPKEKASPKKINIEEASVNVNVNSSYDHFRSEFSNKLEEETITENKDYTKKEIRSELLENTKFCLTSNKNELNNIDIHDEEDLGKSAFSHEINYNNSNINDNIIQHNNLFSSNFIDNNCSAPPNQNFLAETKIDNQMKINDNYYDKIIEKK